MKHNLNPSKGDVSNSELNAGEKGNFDKTFKMYEGKSLNNDQHSQMFPF